MLWKLESECPERLECPLIGISTVVLASTSPRDRDHRLTLDSPIFLRVCLWEIADRFAFEVEMGLKSIPDTFLCRTVPELGRDKSTELAALGKARNKGIAIYTREVGRWDAIYGVEGSQV